MYKPPVPVNENKQCYECKYYYYQSYDDTRYCDAGHGYGEWNIVDSAGTCENWEGEE